jgi:hypothetical protein
MREEVQPMRVGAGRRLLVINPNSNARVTEQVRRVAARVLGSDLIADVVSGKLDVREAAARLPDEPDDPHLVGAPFRAAPREPRGGVPGPLPFQLLCSLQAFHPA